MTVPTVLYLVTEDWFFWSHRLSLGRAARDAGWRVVVAARMTDHVERLRAEGFEPVPLAIARGSAAPLAALRAVIAIARVYRRMRPDLVHHVGMKMCLFGTLAAVLAGLPRTVNAFTGLGYLFTADTWKARLLRVAVLAVLRPLFRRPGVHVIVQNEDDRALLTGRGVAVPDRTWLIRGAGVDVARFRPSPEPAGVPQVTYVGRLLQDKGLAELVEAARRLQAEGRPVRVVLVGGLDGENPQGVAEAVVRGWCADGAVSWQGYRADMPAVWAETTIAVLPSYREGLPKSLLEAGACGRAIVATDVPGCRELIRHGVDGLLVPARDPAALAAAITTLLDDQALRHRLGASVRARIAAEFAEGVVNAATLAVYGLIRAEDPTPGSAGVA